MVVNSKNGTSPAAAGPAGSEFEVKVGSSYLLSMLADAPARGLPGSLIEQVSFQQGDDGYPMDDVILTARGSTGELATLEIQAKRSITFAPNIFWVEDSFFTSVSIFGVVVGFTCL